MLAHFSHDRQSSSFDTGPVTQLCLSIRFQNAAPTAFYPFVITRDKGLRVRVAKHHLLLTRRERIGQSDNNNNQSSEPRVVVIDSATSAHKPQAFDEFETLDAHLDAITHQFALKDNLIFKYNNNTTKKMRSITTDR